MEENSIATSSPVRAAPIENLDMGLLTLAIVAKSHQVDIDVASIAHQLALGGRHSQSEDIVKAAIRSGLKARLLSKQNANRLIEVPVPAILLMNDGSFYVFNHNLANNEYTLHDPLDVRPRAITIGEICARWSGEIILITKRNLVETETHKFGLRWFIKAAERHKATLIHVLICSVFVQLFALVTPLFFQVVVDKVLVHRSTSTLDVIVGGLILIGIFDVVLQYLRSYALYHTASRIDVDLGSQIFDRLFKLPISYFETRAAGQTVTRVREIETIRGFLTGQAITSIIDALFTIIFFAVLIYYSGTLSIVVACSVPLYVLVAITVRPRLRAKIKEKFNRGAASQQYLVESVIGAVTLKAAAVEPILQRQWEERLSAYVKTAFEAVMIGSLGQAGVQYISKLTTALILFFGAKAVMSGGMTVGQLIAFNMISGQLVAPILRLSQLWQDLQQVQVSVDRLGDIFDAPAEEHSSARVPNSVVQGSIVLDGVTFRYRTGAPTALSRVSLEIPAGQVIGIVGPSGSGKSTLTKLIQRLYVPEEGRVLIDGVDLAHVHPIWFRRNIGAVLQENILFDRTIHENIAIANPGMSRGQVIAVARLAGADDFIQQLPGGYETQIQERGANLSGGQRQRIAIARALARNPRILIFDEATSALDYESEQIVQNNMQNIARGRTVIIVAHRLSAVRHCDRIISLSNGSVLEDGSHDDLLHNDNGLYRRLWQLQSRFSDSDKVA